MTDEPGVTMPLPQWQRPFHLRTDPPLPETDPEPTTIEEGSPIPAEGITGPRLVDSARLDEPSPRSEAPGPPRTRTFSGGDPREVAKVLAGLVGIVAGAAAWVLARRGLQLRRPDEVELRDFTLPLGRIAARHLDVSIFSPDLADVTMATAAASNYVMSDPISRTPGAFDTNTEQEHP